MYTSSDIDLVYTTAEYTRPISLLEYPAVVYSSSDIDLVYTAIG